jgi:serine/threonine-protein phosphatase Stp1
MAMAAQQTSGFQFRSVARSHPGKRRAVNEDRVLDKPEDGLWAVADGMGGHRAGDVAAARVVDALAGVKHGASGYARLTDVVRNIDAVNTALFEGDCGDGPRSPSGSTLVALLAHDGHYACLWAGDSRAYLLRDGQLTPITRDHSIVQQLVDGGALLEADRKRHPSAHVITRAIGAGPTVELDQRFAPIMEDDVFLLCSDGLTACLDEHDIARTLSGADPGGAADRLLSAALAGDAPDNISFVIMSVAMGGASDPASA